MGSWCGAQFVFPVAETDAGGAQCVPGAGPSRYDPKCGQRVGAEVLPNPSLDAGDAQRICSFGDVLEQDDTTF